LNRANLSGANLSGADLTSALMLEANLHGAFLPGAALYGTKLTGATLSAADLKNAKLEGAELQNAYMTGANLSGAIMHRATLSGASLAYADLSSTDLRFADLSNADLTRANLYVAKLSDANLSSANLSDAIIYGANLSDANMSKANLSGANLGDADLFHANLSQVALHHAFLVDASFEPSSVIDIRGAELAKGLSTLQFGETATALVLLRDDLRKRGARGQANELTYAIRHQERKHAWRKGLSINLWDRLWSVESWGEKIEAASSAVDAGFNYAAFEITCLYGLYPGRPLRILCAAIPAFALVYGIALVRPFARGGLWRVWSPDRVLKDTGHTEPVRLSATPGWGTPRRGFVYRCLRVVALALYVSILSAFHIGWRDLNVGTWIARIQPREYTLRTTGWVRVVSGLQSLLSVYLIALWVLTYFGRPFD
jgi:uncharacterized protein YjbI with pentapeptide repeats